MIAFSLTLATLATWSYAGFLADPVPPVVPSGAVAIALARMESPPRANPAAPMTPPQPRKPAIPPVEPRSSTERVRYRMADVSGQVWEHPDPTALQAFIDDRNQQFVPADRRGFSLGFRRRR